MELLLKLIFLILNSEGQHCKQVTFSPFPLSFFADIQFLENFVFENCKVGKSFYKSAQIGV